MLGKLPPSLRGSGGTNMGNGSVWEICVRVSDHVCNRLFSIGENGLGTKKIASVWMYLEDIKILKSSFLNLEIIHVHQMDNSKADSLARSVRK